MKRTIAEIDGDIYVYEIAAVAEVGVDWGDDLWTLHAFEEPTIALLDSKIRTLTEVVGASDYRIYLTCDKHNFRKDILPTYKGNRVGVRKPMLIPRLRQHLFDNHKAIMEENLEADDLLGITLSDPQSYENRIVITKDKDLSTIAGIHYRTHHTELGIFEVTQDEADLFHLVQTLSGDVADNYKGCPTIGDVRAVRFLEELPQEERWEKVVALYAKQGLGEEEALVQARVARILRHGEYNFKTKKVKLWMP